MAEKRITDVDFLDSLNGDESFFVNQNSALKQINKGNIVFGIANGGTNAKTAKEARENLGAVSMSTSTAELLVSGWFDNQQIVSVSGVTSDNVIVVAPEASINNYESYAKYGVRCVVQAENALTFECKKVPDIDIVVNIVAFS